MELILEKSLEHQQNAVDAVADVFAGVRIDPPAKYYENPVLDVADTRLVTNIADVQALRGVPAEMLREPVPRAFFEALEAGVRAVHAARFVHLDLHNSRNVMVGPGWRPVLIDWQSALPTGWMPGFLRRALERIDLAGVYKLWNKFRPGELDEARMRFLERSRFIRRHFWIPRLHSRSAGRGRA